MDYLDFEKPIHELEEQLIKCKLIGTESDVDVRDTSAKIEAKLQKMREKVYSNLSAWQRVQLSRHAGRPHTSDYIEHLTQGRFIELHGDRSTGDDKAMVGGIGSIGSQSVLFVGQQKGANTKARQYRNFGMANPGGYRKAFRLFRLAEKFDIPILTLIDTPGAYPGLEAEERGQGEAIARNVMAMSTLRVPVLSVIIGEGASGGALGIGVADRVYMLENTWYSVISPESCSSILWRSWAFKEQAAEALKLTAQDMLHHGLIDGVIEEPQGGAHRDREAAYRSVKATVSGAIAELLKMTPQGRVQLRRAKFYEMGPYKE